MPDFTIIPARAFHCGQMVRRLRHEHARVIMGMRLDVHLSLRQQFDLSSFRRAWLIDGRLEGLGGVVGPMIAATGFLWLALSEEARRYPIALVKEARRQLDEIMIVKRELATTVVADDDAARRLAIFLGFHVADEGRGSRACTRVARRDLARYIETDPDCRIPFGQGYAVAMGYHGQEAG